MKLSSKCPLLVNVVEARKGGDVIWSKYKPHLDIALQPPAHAEQNEYEREFKKNWGLLCSTQQIIETHTMRSDFRPPRFNCCDHKTAPNASNYLRENHHSNAHLLNFSFSHNQTTC